MAGPLMAGGGIGVVVGGLLGVIATWVLVAAAANELDQSFSNVDGGKFLALMMVFAVIGAVFFGVIGLIIGLIVGSNRKSRHNAAYNRPQSWQYPTGPHTPVQPYPAPERPTQ